MPPKQYPKQGEIWWVDLEPTKGKEIRKQRPCIVLQNDAMNAAKGTYLVAPFTKQNKAYFSMVKVQQSKQNGLDQDRCIDIAQMRSVDFSRFSNLQGQMEEDYWPLIYEAISKIFARYRSP